MTSRSETQRTQLHEPDKLWGCNECSWVGRQATMLVGTHPFIGGEQVLGCPKCKNIDSFWEVCDEPGCRERATCGWPMALPKPGSLSDTVVYRRTCSHHYVKGKPA